MTPAHTYRNAIGVVVAVNLGIGALVVVHDKALYAATAQASAVSSQVPRPTLRDLLTASATVSPVPVRRPTPTSVSPCRHNQRRQLVVVSIERQHAWACSGGRTELSTPVTTGRAVRGDKTPRGTFAVQGHTRNTVLRTSRGARYPVRFWVPFRAGIWGFHDAAWQKIPFGTPKFARHGSHGCVHLPTPAMRKLFHWVHDGTKVRIR
ncbi:MAG TPA: L,D-transpeptidase [Mycobacteriales bacterium]|nr:L,D-transpeptidase [Mycobacteriales bacterium]